MTTLEERIKAWQEDWPGGVPRVSLHDFIRAELKSTLEECVEMGEGLKKLERWVIQTMPVVDKEAIAHNQAVSSYQSKLREKIKLLE